MSASRSKRIEALFQHAFDLPVDERAVYLAANADDEEMRAEVETLLRAFDEKADSFLESPAVTVEATGDSAPTRIRDYAACLILDTFSSAFR